MHQYSIKDKYDQAWDSVLATNSLQWLEELEIRSTELLTMKTVRC